MSKDIGAFLIFFGVASVIGALISLGLSFTALSPLVIGGIVGSIVPALLAICSFIPEKNSNKSEEESFTISSVITTALASVAIGVGFAAVATAIFPGAMLGAGSAALTGAVIGVLAFIAGACTAEYVIDPIVEKVFSSKEKGSEPVQAT